jgi:hypothetical protein
LLHIRIIAGGGVTIIPVWWRWRRLNVQLGRGLNVHWGRSDHDRRIHIRHPKRDHDPRDDHHRRRAITIITIGAIAIAPFPGRGLDCAAHRERHHHH